MSSEPVDDKELENIIKWRAMKGFSTWQFDQEHINELVEDLNAHFQKKYLGLLERELGLDVESFGAIPVERIREALANMEGE